MTRHSQPQSSQRLPGHCQVCVRIPTQLCTPPLKKKTFRNIKTDFSCYMYTTSYKQNPLKKSQSQGLRIQLRFRMLAQHAHGPTSSSSHMKKKEQKTIKDILGWFLPCSFMQPSVTVPSLQGKGPALWREVLASLLR